MLPERYELVRRIARGGMASVWCARDLALDRQVAIKLLAEPYAHDEIAVRRFKREARTAARLSAHRNVVTIYDVGQAASDDDSPGRPFIVMEYLPGGTVADALRVAPLEREEIVRWLHEAAAALDFAHRHGVIHRDVKPANFLLDAARALHVADFGIAQLGTDDTLTGTGQVLGTAAYLAPERALGEPATEASDRYSLAIAAFELLTGERPFTADQFTALARQQIEEPPPQASALNPVLPRTVDAVLARGMAKRSAQRWPTAGAMADAIERALGGSRVRMPRALPILPAGGLGGRRMGGLGGRRTGGLGGRRTGALSGSRAAALAALAVVALGVGIAAAESGSGTTHPARTEADVHSLSKANHSPQRTAVASPHSTPSRTAPAAPASTAPASGARPPAPSADALEAQGHQLMLDGNYAAAIGVLRHAVAAASQDSLTYAYALYDLGHSLRLSGDPRAAVAILWRRLQIPNQTDVVRAELQLALQALGRRAARSGGASPGAGGQSHPAGGSTGD